jgi:hypothetical protein
MVIESWLGNMSEPHLFWWDVQCERKSIDVGEAHILKSSLGVLHVL